MAAKILIMTFQLGAIAPHNAGDIITDAALQTQLAAYGAVLVDQATNPGLDALATLARKERASGRRRNAEALMLAGFTAALANGPGATASLLAAGQVQKRSVTIGFANFAALAGGVKTFDVNVGLALPVGARVIGCSSEGFTGFDDALHGTYVAVLGVTTGGNEIATSLNIAAGQSGFPKVMGAGAAGFVGALNSAAQLKARVTSSSDLNTATAGAITLNALFTMLP
jgi:hypothetical protein